MPSGPVTVIGATALVDQAVPVRAATRNPNGDKGLG